MTKLHHYAIDLAWTGNQGVGTASYTSYSRDHELSAPDHLTIPASSEPAYRGDGSRWNPEEMLLSAVAQCHMLWYLHLASVAAIVVVAYHDSPTGSMAENPDGSAQFVEVTLNPRVTIADPAQIGLANEVHDRVGQFCVIARSVNFPIQHNPTASAR